MLFRVPTAYTSQRDKAALKSLVHFKSDSVGNDIPLEKLNKEKFTINQNVLEKGAKSTTQTIKGYSVRRVGSLGGSSLRIVTSPSKLYEKDHFMVRETMNNSPVLTTVSSPRLITAQAKFRSGLALAKKDSIPISTISSPREGLSTHPGFLHRKTMSSIAVKSTDTGDTVHSNISKKLPRGFLIKDFSKHFPLERSPSTEPRSPTLTHRIIIHEGASTPRTQREWKKIGLENQMPRVPSEERQRLSSFLGSEYYAKLINDKEGMSAFQQENTRKEFIQTLKRQHQHQDEYFSRESLLAGVDYLKNQLNEEGIKFKLLRYSQVPEDNPPQQERTNSEVKASVVFGSPYENVKHNYIEELEEDEIGLEGPKRMDFQIASSDEKFVTLHPLVDVKMRYAIRDVSQTQQKPAPNIQFRAPVVRKFGENSEANSPITSPSVMFRRKMKSERFVKIRAALRRVLEKLNRLKIKKNEVSAFSPSVQC